MTDKDANYCTKGIISGVLTWLFVGYLLTGIGQVDPKGSNDGAFIVSLLIALICGVISFFVGLSYIVRYEGSPWARCPIVALLLVLGIIPALWLFFNNL